DELLNHDVKANAVGRKRARTKREMMENVRQHLRRRQRQPDVVRRFFHEKHVAYAV
ncbi:IS630 family transposase, partial [Phormidium tenue FACHB-886]|nr:IS630 family transposase [Phormidium tenue FACHB-886]